MSVHPVDAERRACAVAPATAAVARAASHVRIGRAADGGNRALRLVQIDHARLAALLRDAQRRGDAFDQLFPGALGAVCIGAAGADSAADALANMLIGAAPRVPLAPVQMALIGAGGRARARDDLLVEIEASAGHPLEQLS
ncbi:hypothetical protein [Burkholderia latens]|uniref:hypothetical protein n=1 Tax=Burkholderia latens TaxID=488446 RepID=UPI001FC8AC2B|nr:hypothetical protein [Burkholderia latens]